MSRTKKYAWYVVADSQIVSGWDYREDAVEAKEEFDFEFDFPCIVYDYATVVKLGLNPAGLIAEYTFSELSESAKEHAIEKISRNQDLSWVEFDHLIDEMKDKLSNVGIIIEDGSVCYDIYGQGRGAGFSTSWFDTVKFIEKMRLRKNYQTLTKLKIRLGDEIQVRGRVANKGRGRDGTRMELEIDISPDQWIGVNGEVHLPFDEMEKLKISEQTYNNFHSDAEAALEAMFDFCTEEAHKLLNAMEKELDYYSSDEGISEQLVNSEVLFDKEGDPL